MLDRSAQNRERRNNDTKQGNVYGDDDNDSDDDEALGTYYIVRKCGPYTLSKCGTIRQFE